eukprot:TRINITY_DN120366_c2_g1_i1.p1 TRINITY_DN120366_c2_g1~~TRINITY_DN120366_c2_g1_i1.p1  ORF type:complete len:897 (-),score=130.63 TRINITY_DN120366_c2_g1_i1:2894-5584(-)
MQYLYPILIERLGAEDLEGTAALPEIMRPPPSQKPMVVKAPPEDCEEIRLKMAELMRVLVSTTEESALRSYVDETVNILRTLAMDPHGPVIQEACAAIGELCTHAKDTVFHYSEMLGRALLTALVHKHFKVRLAGIDALRKVMYVGVYKYNVNLMEVLIGFRDPNVVPIKAFYQPDTKVNYFASLIKDEKEVVREAFFKTLIQWMIDLPDKYDHEGRIVPYLLAGLYDSWESIKKMVFEQFEEIGRIHEEEHEKEYREYKQFDYHEEWTYDGEVELLELPPPFAHRPRLGSRILVKNYMKRYLTALLRELEDWQEENRERSVNLLLCSLVYAEGHVTQHADKLFLPLYKALIQPTTKVISQKLPFCITLLGQYLKPKVYLPLVVTALKGDLLAEYASSQLGSLLAIGYLIQGTIDSFPSKFSFGPIKEHIKQVFDTLKENCLDQINVEICQTLVGTMHRIIKSITGKTLKNKDLSLLIENEETIFAILVTAFAFINSIDHSEKVKAISSQITECTQMIDTVLMKGEGKFMIRNIKELMKELLSRSYANLTKHSIELKQILLVYQVLGIDELSQTFTTKDSNEISLMDCAYVLVTKIASESKDKEVVMKSIGVVEALLNKYQAELHTISTKAVSTLSAAYSSDIDPKAVVPLRRRILKIYSNIKKSHKRPLPEEVVKMWLDAGVKALTMASKDIEFRKEAIGFLYSVCEETFEGEGKAELLSTYSEYKQVNEICFEEIWNKNEDIRLFASKCIPLIINHYPVQSLEADKFASPLLLGTLYGQTMPHGAIEKTVEIIKSEEEKHKLDIADVVEKLITFAVDEGGAPRENIMIALKRMARAQTVYLLKEYLTATVQGFLVRIQFLKTLFKDLLTQQTMMTINSFLLQCVSLVSYDDSKL